MINEDFSNILLAWPILIHCAGLQQPNFYKILLAIVVEGLLQIQINPAAITDIETNNQPELHERTAVKDVAKRNPVKKAYEVNISNISSFRNVSKMNRFGLQYGPCLCCGSETHEVCQKGEVNSGQ